MTLKQKMMSNLYKTHIYIGVFVAFHFVIFSITGLILLFRDEIQGGHLDQGAAILGPAQTAENYERIWAQASEKYPGEPTLAFFPDDEDPNLIHARVGLDGSTKLRGSRRMMFDLAAAAPIVEKPHRSSGFFDWILEFHREFFMGSYGKIYVGLVGLAYVFMLGSGFVIYGNFMRRRNFGSVRKIGIPKMVDLHKYLGMITFGWGLVVGLTGVFLAFNGVLIKYFQLQSLQHLSGKYQDVAASDAARAPLAQVIRSAMEALPQSSISYISFPDTEFGISGHYLILLNGTEGLTEKISTLAVINSLTGQLAEIVNLPLYLKIVLLSEPLHFGDYGGWPLKIIWALFALSSLIVVLLGLSSFYFKRVKSKKVSFSAPPVPHRAVYFLEVRYLIPSVLALLSIFGIIAALFSSGYLTYVAMLLVFVPLGFLFFRGFVRA